MNEEIFTVYDSAAKKYLQPFYAQTIDVAMRMFREIVNREGHQFNRFPEDYALYHIGTFDADAGMLQSLTPHSLGVAITYVNRPRLEAGNGQIAG